MSQYQIKDSKGKVHVYGFDRPLSQYFMDRDVGPLSETYGSASNLYGALKMQGLWNKIPEEHRQAILGDLPF